MGKRNIKWNQFLHSTGKVLNISWKVALVIIGLFVAFLIGCAIWEQKEKHYDRSGHYWDSDLIENICVHTFGTGNVHKV